MFRQLTNTLLGVMFLFVSCIKEPAPPISLILETTTASNITSNSVTSGGKIIINGGMQVLEKGVCWSTSLQPTILNNRTQDGTGVANFTSTVIGLLPQTVYYLRSYATTASRTYYGNEIIFATAASLANVTTSPITSITQNSAVCGGNITNSGGAIITQRGVCWNTAPTPTISNNRTTNGQGTGSFTSTITGLTPNTTYYVRAYATNIGGTSYGNELTFSTVTIPTILTSPINSITQTTAISGGTISTDGGSTITQKGVCWSTSSLPTINNNRTFDGTGVSAFTSSITGLSPNTTYYVRAYASNSFGTSYGNLVVLTTNPLTVPTIITSGVSSVTATTALSGGNITSSGGAIVTQRGVCWSTFSNPTISNSRTNDGSGLGTFSSNVTGLNPNTTYYLRAYATNSIGTSYGSQLIFNTTATLPTITTNSISSITQTAFTSGGNISNDGGSGVTQRGICWNTAPTPTISNNRTFSGTGSGSFTATATGLSLNTTYYVRAYATNASGTSYGNQLVLNTLSLGTPTLSSPSNGTAISCCNTNRTFSWTSVTGATNYELNISRSNTFSGTVTTILSCGNSSYPSLSAVRSAITTNTSFCISPGLSSNNGTWYWRVRAISGTVQGSWSSIFSYTYTH